MTSATGSGAVLVEANGNLGGTGRIAGATTIQGTLSPGDEFGVLSFASSLTLAEGSQTKITLGGGGARGSGYSAIDVAGLLTLGGALEITLTDEFSLLGETNLDFQIFNAGSFSGSFETLILPETWNGSAIYWDQSALHSGGILSVSAIPEPGTVALGVFGAFLLVQLRRRALV